MNVINFASKFSLISPDRSSFPSSSLPYPSFSFLLPFIFPSLSIFFFFSISSSSLPYPSLSFLSPFLIYFFSSSFPSLSISPSSYLSSSLPYPSLSFLFPLVFPSLSIPFLPPSLPYQFLLFLLLFLIHLSHSSFPSLSISLIPPSLSYPSLSFLSPFLICFSSSFLSSSLPYQCIFFLPFIFSFVSISPLPPSLRLLFLIHFCPSSSFPYLFLSFVFSVVLSS